MNNRLTFLYNTNNFLGSVLYEKIPYFLSNVIFNKLHFFFYISNLSSHRILFLLKIMLLEKLTNNKLRFIITMQVLRKKILKVGGSIIISKTKMYNLLIFLFYYSIPKLIYSIDSKLVNFHEFYDIKWSVYKIVFFTLTKFLFISYFNHTLDYYNYYGFFEKVMYKLKIKVCTNYKYYLVNRELMRLMSINII